MKEQTYGWYPSVRDVYLSKNQPSPYHLECMYKFKDSGYYNPLAQAPESSLIVKGVAKSPSLPPSRPASCASKTSSNGRPAFARRPKSVPVPKFKPTPKLSIPTPLQCWSDHLAETPYGIVSPAGSAAAPTKQELAWPGQRILSKYDRPYQPERSPSVFDTPIPPPSPDTGGYVFIPNGDGTCQVHSPPVYWPASSPKPPTPQHSVSSRASLGSLDGIQIRQEFQNVFQKHLQEAEDESRKQKARQERFEGLILEEQEKQQQLEDDLLPAPRSAPEMRKPPVSPAKRERTKSATTYRAKSSTPQRPIHSAGLVRPPVGKSSDVVNLPRAEAENEGRVSKGRQEIRTITSSSSSSSSVARPKTAPASACQDDLATIDQDNQDYDEVVKKYGWRAEVHGDPYNIKKTMKRQPYAVDCGDPVIPPEAPGIHMENIETFFLNTIPRRRATFDVHQEWISETLHAKRMELQKREGLKYRWKNFAFVY